ncbi:hypothetical protein F5887DRAFT_79439 [Amanita rubescens]|nr:hypothetical protein F5887DRAFT_79439 [Amanita rubescens]
MVTKNRRITYLFSSASPAICLLVLRSSFASPSPTPFDDRPQVESLGLQQRVKEGLDTLAVWMRKIKRLKERERLPHDA